MGVTPQNLLKKEYLIMNNTPSLTAIILTYNEEIHLQRCINSIKDVCERIIIVDSFSTDGTEQIAKENQVDYFSNKWINYATQFNWGLGNCNITTDWVLRLDADEYLLEGTKQELIDNLELLKPETTGVELPLKRVFMGRHMKYGLGQIFMLRIFRTGKARSENRWMDEHIELFEGNSVKFENGFADDNLNSIAWWTTKHNGYSIREAIDLLDIEYNLIGASQEVKLSNQASVKRRVKLKYVKSPLFLRSFTYFVYRYVFRLGFLDGKEGFLWHFLQGWWYRTLVDAKIYEIKKHCGSDVDKMKQFIKDVYQIDLINNS
ncbi:glycosyltransferase family 2 protein [Flavobacterium sp. NG2]|uniref:glycosyltransferase family 2 protein n=1 Tax=Flavobacterium sp. NG2 TaxID=3097547 RepID=UPI002A809991|nr:glycosyltransferase family 2 protein [Flavobacterium sp. NG2]WPR71643.1 glycosyltransferase family 2 protein [Flavobacterium sp. NG2]